MTFPYVEFLGLVEERLFRPMIPISFEALGSVFSTYALIDSGSDYTILPLEAASRFHFSLADQLQYFIQGAGGNYFKIYRSPIALNCVLKKMGFRDMSSSSYVFFGEAVTTTLLGQKEFLDQFEVILNGPQQEIKITQKS